MKTKALTILVFLAGVLVFSSCSKYEEGGPLLSKKGTLAREWTYDDFEAFGDNDGPDEYYDDYEQVLTFTKEGEFDIKVDYKIGSTSGDYDMEGLWEFVDDKAFVRMLFKMDQNGNTSTWSEMWKIIKLKKTELIVEDEEGDRYTYTAE